MYADELLGGDRAEPGRLAPWRLDCNRPHRHVSISAAGHPSTYASVSRPDQAKDGDSRHHTHCVPDCHVGRRASRASPLSDRHQQGVSTGLEPLDFRPGTARVAKRSRHWPDCPPSEADCVSESLQVAAKRLRPGIKGGLT